MYITLKNCKTKKNIEDEENVNSGYKSSPYLQNLAHTIVVSTMITSTQIFPKKGKEI